MRISYGSSDVCSSDLPCLTTPSIRKAKRQMSTTLNDGFRDWLKANFGTATPSIAAVIAHRMGHDTQSLETADGEHIRALGCSANLGRASWRENASKYV